MKLSTLYTQEFFERIAYFKRLAEKSKYIDLIKYCDDNDIICISCNASTFDRAYNFEIVTFFVEKIECIDKFIEICSQFFSKIDHSSNYVIMSNSNSHHGYKYLFYKKCYTLHDTCNETLNYMKEGDSNCHKFIVKGMNIKSIMKYVYDSLNHGLYAKPSFNDTETISNNCRISLEEVKVQDIDNEATKILEFIIKHTFLIHLKYEDNIVYLQIQNENLRSIYNEISEKSSLKTILNDDGIEIHTGDSSFAYDFIDAYNKVYPVHFGL
ncbi:hypothetical protein D3C87_1025250 [compost metagenome]